MHALCAGQLQEVRGLIASLELPEVPGGGATTSSAAPLAALQGLPAEERAATLASVQAAMNDTMQDISQLLANMHEVGLRRSSMHALDCRISAMLGLLVRGTELLSRPAFCLQVEKDQAQQLPWQFAQQVNLAWVSVKQARSCNYETCTAHACKQHVV